MICTILRVVSSFELVDVTCFQEKRTEASLLIAEKFPWARKNHTLHGLLDHSTDLVKLNGRYVLGSLSEQGLESTNLELLARKSSPLDQITDVTNRLLERSNPIVLSK